MLFLFGSTHLFQTTVSHIGSETEIIPSGAGLRLEGTPALNLWDLVIDVLEPQGPRNRLDNTKPKETKSRIAGKKLTDSMNYVHPNAHSSCQRASPFAFEDNDAVIKMMIKGRNPTMRHISRTHRDRFNVDSDIQIKYVNTSKQIADIVIKGSFTRDKWLQLTQVFNLMTPHMHSCSHSLVCSSVQKKRRQHVQASARTYHRKRYRQTKAGA